MNTKNTSSIHLQAATVLNIDVKWLHKFAYVLFVFILLVPGISIKSASGKVRTAITDSNSAKEKPAMATGAHVYYVGTSGNDSNEGTSASTAWRTIKKVNAHLFEAGDQVLFEGGEKFKGMLYIRRSGSSGNPIRFASYGTGKAIVNGGNSTGIYVHNCSFITIDSLVVSGGWNPSQQKGNTGYGILFYNDLPNAEKLGEVAVSNCEVTGFKKSGIAFMAYPADKSQGGYSKITATGNRVYGNGASGISSLGPAAMAGSNDYAFDQVYMAHNLVYDNLGIKSNTTSHSGNGIIIGDAGGGMVEHNTAYNNGWYNAAAKGGPAAIWCYDSKNIIFQYNEAHHNGTGAGTPDGDGFDLDGGAVNCIMQYNYSHDNYGAGFLVWEYGNSRTSNANNIIRYNISQNDNTNNNNTVYGGICIGPQCDNNLIYNNTIWSKKGSCIFITGGNNNQFYNNIFVNQSRAPVISSNRSKCLFVNNIYYNPKGVLINFNGKRHSSLSSFRKTGNEKLNGKNHGYVVNPRLQNPGVAGSINAANPVVLTNYLPRPGSPAINKAIDLTTLGYAMAATDFNKMPLPVGDGYDIGACEHDER